MMMDGTTNQNMNGGYDREKTMNDSKNRRVATNNREGIMNNSVGMTRVII